MRLLSLAKLLCAIIPQQSTDNEYYNNHITKQASKQHCCILPNNANNKIKDNNKTDAIKSLNSIQHSSAKSDRSANIVAKLCACNILHCKQMQMRQRISLLQCTEPPSVQRHYSLTSLSTAKITKTATCDTQRPPPTAHHLWHFTTFIPT